MKTAFSHIDQEATTYNKKVSRAKVRTYLKCGVANQLKNEATKLVAAIFELEEPFDAQAISKCHEEDTFNEEKGKVIALRKAERTAYMEGYKRAKHLEEIISNLKVISRKIVSSSAAHISDLTDYIDNLSK
jgi:hypothetical protein